VLFRSRRFRNPCANAAAKPDIPLSNHHRSCPALVALATLFVEV
jgi:hypothetical protein